MGTHIATTVVPLVRIALRYPMGSVKQHIEGWVKVQFTITKKDKVDDEVVVDSNQKNVFDWSDLSAIKRW
jgi:TonB family protein